MGEQVKTTESGSEQQQDLRGLIQNPTGKQKLKFIIPSAIGVFLFLCPIWYEGNMNIPLGVISEWVANFIKPWAHEAILGIVVISAIMTFITSVFKPKALTEGKLLSKLFVASPIYLVIRVLGGIIVTLVYFQVGPEWIYSADTGSTMIGLMSTLIAWFFAASFLIPLLMDYGIMDYTGTLIRNLLWPLFRLPGRAAVDLCASWVGNCNVGVVLTSTQYEQGYYTARESVLIATCFSAVSLPFCLVIAAMMGVEQYFIPFYLILTVTGIVSVVIMSRIWPLAKKYPDEYYALAGKQINEVEPKGISKTRWAYLQAVTKAESGPNFGELMYKGIDMFLGIIFTLVPVTMCVGTLALVLSTYTPIFDWISMPFGYYLQVLGVQDAFAAAPGTVVGFADMFIPAVICANIPSIETRFIIGILSLVQIIYMSEVGSIMLASKMPVKITDLIIIFLEKTIISIPIIVLLTKLFVSF
ncbi:YjiH family protein [Sinanaerobacter sp. ZZT-01]|uniref:YjiH family protein n=1 Tax=Sinanaerobacter sp. ZZT-01 TaxID=3111540 RepID=UPI002D782541|nr:YjiH family protein [Sinanaerobacter sp. ZZT-01]WRR92499.1 YjiH family protein [Sinanaerobacter sp. ZZT-01]